MLSLSQSLAPDTSRGAAEVIDGEAIIINLTTGVYYSMQAAGAELWSMIERGESVEAMLAGITSRYDVDAGTALADLNAVLEKLLAEGLVRKSENGHREAVVAAGSSKLAYTPPSLQIYRDMEDLLALDPPAPGMNQIAWQDKASKS